MFQRGSDSAKGAFVRYSAGGPRPLPCPSPPHSELNPPS